MYSVKQITHPSYGVIVAIEHDISSGYVNPYQAMQNVSKLIRIIKESGSKKVRVFIDEKVMTFKQAEQWADEEYKSLPKCDCCAAILQEDLFTHNLSVNRFCSQKCADQDYVSRTDKLMEEEDIECF